MIFGLSFYLLQFFLLKAKNLEKIFDLAYAIASLHIVIDFVLVSSALIFLNVSLFKMLKDYKKQMKAQTSDLSNANTVETLNNSILQLELTMANGGILTISQFLKLLSNIMVVST